MSILEFRQDDGIVRGFFGYEADPSWTVEPPAERGSMIGPWVKTEEGEGSWLVFDRRSHRWGALLRSTETPYNDCLPPGESLLVDAFENTEAASGLVNFLTERTEEAFLNSYQAILGAPGSNELVHFKGSFQTDSESLSSSPYVATDSVEPVIESDGLLRDLTGPGGTINQFEDFPPPDQLLSRLDDRLENNGLREVRSLIVFFSSPGEIRLNYFHDPLNGTSARALRVRRS